MPEILLILFHVKLSYICIYTIDVSKLTYNQCNTQVKGSGLQSDTRGALEAKAKFQR